MDISISYISIWLSPWPSTGSSGMKNIAFVSTWRPWQRPLVGGWGVGGQEIILLEDYVYMCVLGGGWGGCRSTWSQISLD